MSKEILEDILIDRVESEYGIMMLFTFFCLPVHLITVLVLLADILWYGFGNDFLITDYYKQFTLIEEIQNFWWVILMWSFLYYLFYCAYRDSFKNIKQYKKLIKKGNK